MSGFDKQIFGVNEQVRGLGSERLSGVGPDGDVREAKDQIPHRRRARAV